MSTFTREFHFESNDSGGCSFLQQKAEESERRLEPEASDRKMGTQKAGLPSEEILSKELDDGTLVEVIEDPQDSGKTVLAVGRNGQISFVKELEYHGRLLHPISRENPFLRHVQLPSGTIAYSDALEPISRVSKLLRSCVDLSEEYAFVTAAFVATTYIWDRLPVPPYLQIVGPPQSGKTTLLNVLGLVCHRAFLVGDLSSAAFYKACDTYAPTLLLDESDSQIGQSSRALRHLLRLGTSHEAIVRDNAAYSIFGPKAVVSPVPLDDPALNSRCIFIPMSETEKSDLKCLADPSVQDAAREARNCLLQFRFANYNSISLPVIPDLNRLRPRARDLWKSLAAVLPADRDLYTRLFQIIKSQPATRQESLPADLSAALSVLNTMIHVDNNCGSDESKWSDVFVGYLAEIANQFLSLQHERTRLSARGFGALLDSFGTFPRRRTNKGRAVCLDLPTRRLIHKLVKRYNPDPPFAPWMSISTERCPICQGKDTEEEATPQTSDKKTAS